MLARAAFGLVIAAAVLVARPGAAGSQERAPDHVVMRSDKVMGTRVTVSIYTDDEVAAAKAAQEVFAEFARVDALMTTWKPDSEVSKINAQGASRPVAVSDETLAVILKSLEVSRKSAGAFDITVGVLLNSLWKFDEDKDGSLPSPEAVEARLPLVGYRNVLVNKARKTVKLGKKGVQINLGGIAKGYAVDRAVKLLHDRGYVDFLIQAGGDLYVAGRRGDRNWRVGIRDPRGDRDSTFGIAAVEDRTFSTSGDYERFLIKDGVRYHHIIDPVTGQPARRSRSVTVLARDAITADAWSTALFVLGVEKGMPLVEEMPDVDAVFVDADNKVHVSSGLEGKIWIHRQPTPGT